MSAGLIWKCSGPHSLDTDYGCISIVRSLNRRANSRGGIFNAEWMRVVL